MLLTVKSKKVAMEHPEWHTLDEKAHLRIMLCLADEVIIEVADEESVAGMWLKLENLYISL